MSRRVIIPTIWSPRITGSLPHLSLITRLSTWDTSSSAGPARRVYHLTEEGDRYLTAWMADLHETVDMLEAFVAEYERHMARGEGEYH